MHRVAATLTRLGIWTASPAAFLVVVLYVLVWILVEPRTFDLHGVATIATWLMTLFIQRAEHRDTQALHAKLDELLAVHGDARTELSRLDEEEPEKVEEFREEMRRDQNV